MKSCYGASVLPIASVVNDFRWCRRNIKVALNKKEVNVFVPYDKRQIKLNERISRKYKT